MRTYHSTTLFTLTVIFLIIFNEEDISNKFISFYSFWFASFLRAGFIIIYYYIYNIYKCYLCCFKVVCYCILHCFSLYTLCPISSGNNISYKRLVFTKALGNIFFWQRFLLFFSLFRDITGAQHY
jgi:hypothetical protein